MQRESTWMPFWRIMSIWYCIVESTLEEGTLLYGASQAQATATKWKKDKMDNTISARNESSKVNFSPYLQV